MQSSMFTRYVCLILSVLLVSGCGSSANPSIQLIELSSSTITYEEVIRINNCGGKADSEQTVSRSFATSIEGEGSFSVGYKSIVEGGISAKYGQYRNMSKSQRLVAPPGTDMQFVLRWSEDVRAGNVSIDGKTGTYEVRIPIAVEQVSSKDLGCVSVAVPPQASTLVVVVTASAFTPSQRMDNLVNWLNDQYPGINFKKGNAVGNNGFFLRIGTPGGDIGSITLPTHLGRIIVHYWDGIGDSDVAYSGETFDPFGSSGPDDPDPGKIATVFFE